MTGYEGTDTAALAYADFLARSGAGHLIRLGDADVKRTTIQQTARATLRRGVEEDLDFTRETARTVVPASTDAGEIARATGMDRQEAKALAQDPKKHFLADALAHAASLVARRELVLIEPLAEDARRQADTVRVPFTTGVALAGDEEPAATVTGTVRYAASDDGPKVQDVAEVTGIRPDGERVRLSKVDVHTPKQEIPETDRPASPVGALKAVLAGDAAHELHAAASATLDDKPEPPATPGPEWVR